MTGDGRTTNMPGPGPRRAKDIAVDMFRTYGRGFARMLVTAAVVMVPLLLAGRTAFGADFAALFEETTEGTPPPLSDTALVGTMAYALLYLLGILAAGGAVAEEAARSLIGSDVSIGRAYGVVIRRLPAMLGAGLLTALAAGVPLVLAVSMATSSRSMADVILLAFTTILAIFVAVRLAFAVFICLLEQVGPTEAIARSWRLVSGAWPRTFALLVLVAFLVGVVQLALQYVGSMEPTAAAIGSAIAVAPLTTIGNLLIYLDLRARKEGCSAETLATELDNLERYEAGRL